MDRLGPTKTNLIADNIPFLSEWSDFKKLTRMICIQNIGLDGFTEDSYSIYAYAYA